MSKVPLPTSEWLWGKFVDLSDENQRAVRLFIEFLLLKQVMGNDK